jgi:phage terminase small subunit
MRSLPPPLSGSDPAPAGGRLSDRNIHSCLAMPDKVLRNPRHERFAQELASGTTADAAYVLAGYKENRSNAARLNASQNIQKRVAEIQSLGAERAAITIENLRAEAEAARSKAMREKGGANAAVAAITAKAKLAGLWREKVAQTDPSGENAPRYIISDRPMTEEEWIRERCGE